MEAVSIYLGREGISGHSGAGSGETMAILVMNQGSDDFHEKQRDSEREAARPALSWTRPCPPLSTLAARAQQAPARILPPVPMCTAVLGEVLSGRTFLRANSSRLQSQQTTHRRSLPDELDGELLAVKERGLVWRELGIQIENLLLQALLVELLERLLFHSNNWKVAADDG